jgi:hypothetical protein
MTDLCDTGVLLWSEQQAGLLRRRAAGELINEADLDWPHAAKEIEALGKSERPVLAGHIATVIEHLAKLEASPATAPRAGWQETVLRARADIGDILDSSPSLRRMLEAGSPAGTSAPCAWSRPCWRCTVKHRECRWTASNTAPTRCSGRGSRRRDILQAKVVLRTCRTVARGANHAVERDQPGGYPPHSQGPATRSGRCSGRPGRPETMSSGQRWP